MGLGDGAQVDFSRSRSTRNLFNSVDGPPGPGTYTPAGNIADKLHDPEMLDPLNPNLPSSSFASRVPLKHQVRRHPLAEAHPHS
jgi:hypothetical protein